MPDNPVHVVGITHYDTDDFFGHIRHLVVLDDAQKSILAARLSFEHSQRILDAMEGAQAGGSADAPKMANLQGLPKFLQNLKNQGMNPFAVGDFPQEGVAPLPSGADNRPYLVR